MSVPTDQEIVMNTLFDANSTFNNTKRNFKSLGEWDITNISTQTTYDLIGRNMSQVIYKVQCTGY